MTCCDIFEVFDEQNLIKEYTHWKLLIRNRNTTLGNCVAITKRHMERFSEITEEEMAEFQKVVKDVESALKQVFNYDKINYQMLMMKDKHTHFHIVPRYSETKQFANQEWTDDGWPKLPVGKKDPVPQETLNQVRDELKKHVF
ncbi:MAG: HIT family protein [Candidatus Nanoarchaeia archaeon]